jgi:hypothetical protein
MDGQFTDETRRLGKENEMRLRKDDELPKPTRQLITDSNNYVLRWNLSEPCSDVVSKTSVYDPPACDLTFEVIPNMASRKLSEIRFLSYDCEQYSLIGKGVILGPSDYEESAIPVISQTREFRDSVSGKETLCTLDND